MVTPYGRMEAAWTRLDGGAETGAGLLNLSYGEQTLKMLSGVAGLRLGYDLPLELGVLTPQVRVEYSHDFAGGSDASIGYLDMGGLMPFTTAVETLSRDTLSLNLGATLQFNGGLVLGLDYDLLLGIQNNVREHGVSAHIGGSF